MARPKNPYTISKRQGAKTFQLTLNTSAGLPSRICQEWHRRSFINLPDELAQFRNPNSMPAARVVANALIEYLKRQAEEGYLKKTNASDITAGVWIEKFTKIETSPRTGINAAKNRANSGITLYKYRSYWDLYIKDAPITKIKMWELEETDMLQYINRLSVIKKSDGSQLAGTRTYAGVIIFLRMVCRSYQKEFPRWINPFVRLDPPKYKESNVCALSEDEVVKLFMPGVLKTPMEFAVCAVMFLSGLRRAEIAALRPEDLNWHTGEIRIKRAWQMFDMKSRVLGPPKGKKERDAPFDPLLQKAIKNIWEKHGEYEWVFSVNGKHLSAKWIDYRFKQWLKDAGIELNGRKIVPHSSRHSLATLLEDRGVSIRHIQDLLGHSDLKTTKKYLHTTAQTIRKVGEVISVAIGKQEQVPPSNVIPFTKVS